MPKRARPIRSLLRLRLLPPLAAGACGVASVAMAQERDSARVEVGAEERKSRAVPWVGAGALLAGSILLDRTVEATVPDRGGQRFEELADALNPLGNPKYSVPLLAGTYLAARVADRPAVSEGAAHVLAGLAVAGVANGTLKFAVGRERPSATDDPHRFRPFNGDNRFQAFPSGHATVAFALAASVSEEARTPWVTAATYGTAGLVAWSRVYEAKHWTSDVVAGSLVGIAAGRGTVRLLHRRAARRGGRSGARVAVVPGGVVVRLPTR